MKDGFVTVAAATPVITVADCNANTQAILECIHQAYRAGAKIIVLPELCITAYTCSDLFWQTELLDRAEDALDDLIDKTREIDALVLVGLPLRAQGKLYNVAAVFHAGELLGFVPKVNLPAYNEFYEA